jgi:hypothetical protein
VSILTSPVLLVKGECFSMLCCLSKICLVKTDDPDFILDISKAQHMQSPVQIAHGNDVALPLTHH